MSVSPPRLTISREEIDIAPADVAGDQGPDLFPLPLGPYERYMLVDDTPEYPMNFVVAIDVSGDLRRDAFECALQATLQRHPLFACCAARIRGRGWCWISVPGATPRLDWEETDVLPECPRGKGIDLTREVGLRIQVRRERTRARVGFQFHHATTDGLGAMQFIGDLLALYGRLTALPGEEAPELETLNPKLLEGRARIWPDGEKAGRGFLASAARRTLELLSQWPVPIATPRRSGLRLAGSAQSPAFVSRCFARDVFQGLKQQAAARAVTVNDLLVLEMFRTIREWNRMCGRKEERAWYRIGIPLSLRTPREDSMPAANVLSFMFLTRRARDCDGDCDLLNFIHRESQHIAQGRLRVMFPFMVRILMSVPGLLTGLLKFPICQATAILSNVGDVRRAFHARFPLHRGRCVAGNIRLENLRGASPIRCKTRVAVSLGTYAGALFVNMQCDRRYFTSPEAEQLADLFAERIYQRARSESMLKVAS